MKFKSVAWVPDNDPTRDWEDAASLAATWVEGRRAEDSAAGLLVTNALGSLGVRTLDTFGYRHAHTSPRAGRDRVPRGNVAVLSYVPYAEQLEFAMNLARGSSIAVVETVGFPLAGWAAWLEAWDLVRDAPTPPLPEPLHEAVDELKFYGNNGFGDSYGKGMAQRILADLPQPAEESYDVVLSAVIAAGVSSHGVKNLKKLMGRRR